MKFIIKKEYLIEGLNNVSKAISSKNLIPILAGIKFELKKDDSVKIPVGMHHKWENNSDGEVRIIFAVIL